MKRFVIVMLAVSLITAGIVSWFASSHPDGLERVAEDLKFMSKAGDSVFNIFPDYTVPGLKGFLSTSLAGIIGVCATFGFIMLIGRVFFRKKR